MQPQAKFTEEEACRPDIVRSVVRAFSLLRLMNFRQYWTLQELHDETGLPKATLWRLLSTLRHEGYVLAEDKVGTYRLSSKVRELDDGYTESNRMVDLARPILIETTKRIKWPCALGTLDGDSMVVRFSSARHSPLALFTTTVGLRRELLTTAMGRSYLAFCSEKIRMTLLEHVAPASLPVIEDDLAQVRAVGYAVRSGTGDPASSTMAVPVYVDRESVATLSMTTFPRSMNVITIEKHYPVLVDAAEQISLQFRSAELASTQL